MPNIFHGWRRKAGVVLRVIFVALITFAMILGIVEFIGYDSGNCFDDPLYGIDLKVYHPRFVDYSYAGEGILNDEMVLIGMRRTYDWTERFGRIRSPRHHVEIISKNLRPELTVDGRRYGFVDLSDSIVIDRGSVAINGKKRLPDVP